MPLERSGHGGGGRPAPWRRAVAVALAALVGMAIWKLPLIIALHAQARWERDFGPANHHVLRHPTQAPSVAALRIRSALTALASEPGVNGTDVAIILNAANGSMSPPPPWADEAVKRFYASAPQVDAFVGAVLSASPRASEDDLLGLPETLLALVYGSASACMARAVIQSKNGQVQGAQRSLDAAWVLTEPWLKASHPSSEFGQWNLSSACSVLCACDQAWPGWEGRLSTCAPGPDNVTILRTVSLDHLAWIRSGRGPWKYDLTLGLADEAGHDSAVQLSTWDACSADPSWVTDSVSRTYGLPQGWLLMHSSLISQANYRLALSAVVTLTRRVLVLREMRQVMDLGGLPDGAAVTPPPDLPCPGAHISEAQLPDGRIQLDVRGLPPWVEQALRYDWRSTWPHGVTVCGEPTP